MNIHRLPQLKPGKISDDYIKKHQPKGYVIVTYDPPTNTSVIYEFDDKVDDAWNFFMCIPDSDPYAVVYKNGKILSENT
jgi:hypothetical protein